MTHNSLKDGAMLTYSVLQNTLTYQIRLTNCNKGLWICIEESGLTWKLTITSQMVQQTVTKASGSQQHMTLKDFTSFLLASITKSSERWSIGIMTPIQLEVLRGGNASKQASNNKIYMILSDKQKKFHYPFTFTMNEIGQKDKLLEAIKTMKTQLQDLRNERADKSQSSFSIMSQVGGNTSEQLKMENQELKRKIKMYEDSLTQKRGAVEIDLILKQKNNLELLSQTKKREENRQIARLKNIYQMMNRQISQIRNEVDHINKQLMLVEDSVGNNAKLKSHAMKVIKSYQNQLRTQKKVLQKQIKEIQNAKRNILTSKNNERKVLTKIKQIQLEIDQAKKKANIKQISNRLHSVGKSSNHSSSKAPSEASSQGKAPSEGSSKQGANIVRDNLLKKTTPLSNTYNRNNLLRTSPNINTNANIARKASDENKGRAINSSHQIPASRPNYVRQTNQKYRSGSKSQNQNSSVRSEKKQFTAEEKQKQKKAMERLTGGRNIIPRAPSNEKDKPKQLTNIIERSKSNKQVGKSLQNKNQIMKKNDPNGILSKMKEVKAHYNNQASKNSAVNKNLASKISELTDKKYL